MIDEWFTHPNRLLCYTLEDMRKLLAHINHRSVPTLKGLVEECQVHANRMEAALEDWSDIRSGHEKKQEIKDEIKKLKAEKKKLDIEMKRQTNLLTEMDTIKGSKRGK